MSFNFRVVQRESMGEFYYEVLEIYYKNNVPVGSGESHNILYGDTVKDLKNNFNLIKKALSLPTLKWDEEQQKYIEI